MTVGAASFCTQPVTICWWRTRTLGSPKAKFTAFKDVTCKAQKGPQIQLLFFFVFCCFFFFLMFLETGSHYVAWLAWNSEVAQIGLELVILLPQPLKCWNYRRAPPYPAQIWLLQGKNVIKLKDCMYNLQLGSITLIQHFKGWANRGKITTWHLKNYLAKWKNRPDPNLSTQIKLDTISPRVNRNFKLSQKT
jgi:hypothetical protein